MSKEQKNMDFFYTPKEYRKMIIEMIEKNEDIWVLKQIYRYTKNMTKEG